MFDDKTGLSLIGYTYNIRQTEMDEFFIGAGTMIAGFTGSAGWKHYYKKSKLSFYSVLSGQGVAFMGFFVYRHLGLVVRTFTLLCDNSYPKEGACRKRQGVLILTAGNPPLQGWDFIRVDLH